jgi:hypothetical protein
VFGTNASSLSSSVNQVNQSTVAALGLSRYYPSRQSIRLAVDTSTASPPTGLASTTIAHSERACLPSTFTSERRI